MTRELTGTERRMLRLWCFSHDNPIPGGVASESDLIALVEDIITARTDDLRARLAATEIKLAATRLALAACREVREARDA